MKYSLQDLKKMFGIDAGTLRYYDNHDLMPEMQRDEHGYRYVDEADLSSVELICILKECGCSIKEMAEIKRLTEMSKEQSASENKVTYSEIVSSLRDHINDTISRQIELAEQMRSSEWMLWYFSRAAHFGQTSVDWISDPEFLGKCPDRLVKIMSLGDESINELHEDSYNAFREKYPGYGRGDDE